MYLPAYSIATAALKVKIETGASEQAPSERVLAQLSQPLHGVALIAANLATCQITIEYDPDSASAAEIAAYLATSGYPVAGETDEF